MKISEHGIDKIKGVGKGTATDEKCAQIYLIGKTVMKSGSLLESPRHGREDSVKNNLRQKVCKIVECIHLAQVKSSVGLSGTEQTRFRFPYMAGKPSSR